MLGLLCVESSHTHDNLHIIEYNNTQQSKMNKLLANSVKNLKLIVTSIITESYSAYKYNIVEHVLELFSKHFINKNPTQSQQWKHGNN